MTSERLHSSMLGATCASTRPMCCSRVSPASRCDCCWPGWEVGVPARCTGTWRLGVLPRGQRDTRTSPGDLLVSPSPIGIPAIFPGDPCTHGWPFVLWGPLELNRAPYIPLGDPPPKGAAMPHGDPRTQRTPEPPRRGTQGCPPHPHTPQGSLHPEVSYGDLPAPSRDPQWRRPGTPARR